MFRLIILWYGVFRKQPMLSAKPKPTWDSPADTIYEPRKRQPLAVYELSRRQPVSFFNYLGKFTLLCLIGASLYAAFVWAARGHSATATASSTSETVEDTTPVVAQGPQPQGPKLGYVASWNITPNSASISWSTDVAATSALSYGTTKALGQSVPVQTKLEMTHGVTLSGLKSNTTYYFVAQSADKAGLIGYSATGSFSTPSMPKGPAIAKIRVIPGKNNQVQISWTTSIPANSYFEVGSTTAYNRYSTRTELTTNPKPAISWVPSGIVHYQLISTDAKGNKTESPDFTFVEP